MTTLSRTEFPDHAREECLLSADSIPSLPLYVLKPMETRHGGGPFPIVLALHGHGPFGHDPVVGIDDSPERAKNIRNFNYDFGRQLVREGYLVVAPCLTPFGRRLDESYKNNPTDPCAITFVRLMLLGQTLMGANLRDVKWALAGRTRPVQPAEHKLRAPRDHNRDYEGKSIYPEVSALRERVPAWLKGKPLFALDMHCPYIREENIYFVGSPDHVMWEKVVEFSRLLEAIQQGPIRYTAESNMPYPGYFIAEGRFGARLAAVPSEKPGLPRRVGFDGARQTVTRKVSVRLPGDAPAREESLGVPSAIRPDRATPTLLAPLRSGRWQPPAAMGNIHTSAAAGRANGWPALSRDSAPPGLSQSPRSYMPAAFLFFGGMQSFLSTEVI